MDYRCPDCSKYTGPKRVELPERCGCSDTNKQVNHHAKFYLAATIVAAVLHFILVVVLTWYVADRIGVVNSLVVMGAVLICLGSLKLGNKLLGETKWRMIKERNNWR